MGSGRGKEKPATIVFRVTACLIRPIVHRQQRVLRRHIILLEFLGASGLQI